MSSIGIAHLAAVAVVAVLPLASAQTEAYSCSTRVRYTTSCGFLGWHRCTRYRSQVKTCYRLKVVHGGWTSYGAWSPYTTCTQSCDGGSQERNRTRSCTNPVPANGGRDCAGSTIENESRPCNTHMCPVHGNWTEWEEWQDMDDCTVLCGGGGNKDQERSRTCTHPIPAYGGADCEGENYQNQTVTCGEEDCGERCPEGNNTYLTHATNKRRFYQCSNGVAHRHNCAEGTVFDPEAEIPGCKHASIPTTPKPAGICPGQFSTLADEGDCNKYIQCVHGTPFEHSCPTGTRFDRGIKVCVHGEC